MGPRGAPRSPPLLRSLPRPGSSRTSLPPPRASSGKKAPLGGTLTHLCHHLCHRLCHHLCQDGTPGTEPPEGGCSTPGGETFGRNTWNASGWNTRNAPGRNGLEHPERPEPLGAEHPLLRAPVWNTRDRPTGTPRMERLESPEQGDGTPEAQVEHPRYTGGGRARGRSAPGGEGGACGPSSLRGWKFRPAATTSTRWTPAGTPSA